IRILKEIIRILKEIIRILKEIIRILKEIIKILKEIIRILREIIRILNLKVKIKVAIGGLDIDTSAVFLIGFFVCLVCIALVNFFLSLRFSAIILSLWILLNVKINFFMIR